MAAVFYPDPGRFVVCEKVATGAGNAPCNFANGFEGANWQSSLLTVPLVTPEGKVALQAIIDAGVGEPINYADLGAIWTFGFSLTLTLWLIAKNAGAVVNAVRRF